MGYVLALKWNLKDMVELSYTYSYRHYGVWWGVTCFGVIAVFAATFSYVYSCNFCVQQ
jgi:ABC-type multidrug transport system permease subunit